MKLKESEQLKNTDPSARKEKKNVEYEIRMVSNMKYTRIRIKPEIIVKPKTDEIKKL